MKKTYPKTVVKCNQDCFHCKFADCMQSGKMTQDKILLWNAERILNTRRTAIQEYHFLKSLEKAQKKAQEQHKMGIAVGKHAKVRPVTFGSRDNRMGIGNATVRYPCECECISINPQGIALLEFKTKSGNIIRECFKLGHPELDVEWR